MNKFLCLISSMLVFDGIYLHYRINEYTISALYHRVFEYLIFIDEVSMTFLFAFLFSAIHLYFAFFVFSNH